MTCLKKANSTFSTKPNQKTISLHKKQECPFGLFNWHCTIVSPPPPFSSVIGLCFFFPFKYLYVLAYIFLYWHNKFHNIVKAQMHSSYSVLLVCSIGIIAIVPTVFFPFLFSHRFVLFFFFPFKYYMSWHIYCHTNITNFTIFWQLLRCQFFISRNKIIKY